MLDWSMKWLSVATIVVLALLGCVAADGDVNDTYWTMIDDEDFSQDSRTSFIALTVIPSQPCNSWIGNDNNARAVATAIQSSLTQVVQHDCQCNFTSTQIGDEAVRCGGNGDDDETTDTAIYTANITRPAQYSSNKLTDTIANWVNGRPETNATLQSGEVIIITVVSSMDDSMAPGTDGGPTVVTTGTNSTEAFPDDLDLGFSGDIEFSTTAGPVETPMPTETPTPTVESSAVGMWMDLVALLVTVSTYCVFTI